MQTLLFAIPLKPGKLAAYKTFGAEITGPRKREYTDLLKRYGLNTVKVWHCKFGDRDYVMVMHDADDDAPSRLEKWASSTHPFDLWFSEQLLNCYDVKNLQSLPEQPHFVYGHH